MDLLDKGWGHQWIMTEVEITMSFLQKKIKVILMKDLDHLDHQDHMDL